MALDEVTGRLDEQRVAGLERPRAEPAGLRALTLAGDSDDRRTELPAKAAVADEVTDERAAGPCRSSSATAPASSMS
jgi:hypothetical protein